MQTATLMNEQASILYFLKNPDGKYLLSTKNQWNFLLEVAKQASPSGANRVSGRLLGLLYSLKGGEKEMKLSMEGAGHDSAS